MGTHQRGYEEYKNIFYWGMLTCSVSDESTRDGGNSNLFLHNMYIIVTI